MKEYVSRRKLFGREVEFVLYDVDKLFAEDVCTLAYNEGLRLQNIFNFYDAKSELSILNRKTKLRVSLELLEVLKRSIVFCSLTEGEYDISHGEIFLKRKQGLPEPKVSYSYKNIQIQGNLVRRHSDMHIDLGSIAKGYIVDKMAERLLSHGVLSGIVDGRGDLRVFGEQTEIIKIQHPRDKEKFIAELKLKNMAVATSGDYNQFNSDFEHSHIVNKKYVISATVIAENLVDADALATVLCVVDTEKGLGIMKLYKEIPAMIIDNNLKITYLNNFERYIV